MKIRQGDTVLIISGKDKGKSGAVQRVLATDGLAIVTGVNIRTRHIKKTTQEAGRKIKYEAALSVSKMMIIDPKTGKPSRIGFQIKDGKKIRISKKSGVEVVQAKAKVEKKKETKEAKESKESKEVKKKADVKATETPKAGKQPFWKKMKFGSAAMEQQADVQEPSHMEQDHTIPAQELHRKGGRGT